MDRQKLDPKQVDQLLAAAGKKLGVPPAQLRQELESGKYDKVLKNMSPKDSAMLQKVLKNPEMVEKLVSSPQAQALYQKKIGGRADAHTLEEVSGGGRYAGENGRAFVRP